MKHLSALTSDELLASLLACRAREVAICAEVIAHLAEVARRRLYITEACSALWRYCSEVLGYSEEESHRRATAANLVVRYPLVLEMLRKGELHMSALLLLNPVLADDNYEERLKAAVGKSCERIKLLIATWAPKPHVATTVFRVKLDERPALLERMVEERRVQERGAGALPAETPIEQAQLPPPPRAPSPKPLDASHYQLKFTIDAETYENLMRLTDLVRHSVPDGDPAKVISKAIKDQLKAVQKKKLGRTDKPKQLPIAACGERAPDKSRAPSAPTRREVSERDGDRCCYESPSGKRCTSTAWIEFDHKIMVAAGGETSTKNVRLFCRVHNNARNAKPIRDIADGARADGGQPTNPA